MSCALVAISLLLLLLAACRSSGRSLLNSLTCRILVGFIVVLLPYSPAAGSACPGRPARPSIVLLHLLVGLALLLLVVLVLGLTAHGGGLVQVASAGQEGQSSMW